jgi:two-component system LytT family response regulator
VFVTAHDEYALRAFEVHAVDYLLKPFDRERFRGAYERARELFHNRNAQEQQSRLTALDLLGLTAAHDRAAEQDTNRAEPACDGPSRGSRSERSARDRAR